MFLDKLFSGPSHEAPCLAHHFENSSGCMFLQILSWAYLEWETNVQESQLCQRLRMQPAGQNLPLQQQRVRENLLAARNSACGPSLLWSSHSLLIQLPVRVWSLFIPILFLRVWILHFQSTGLTESSVYLQMNPAEPLARIQDYNLNRFQPDWKAFHLKHQAGSY